MVDKQEFLLPDSLWNVSAAETSLDRWLSLCEQENWQPDAEAMELVARVFGSSWYFTRFIFYSGEDAFRILRFTVADLQPETLLAKLRINTDSGDTETVLEALRINKNKIMLQIFIGFLTHQIDQAETESALTHLAEFTLATALDIVFTDDQYKKHFAVLGMGRMAGEEMTFGSDLDLVFLYTGDSDELFTSLCRQVRIFLREIAALSPAGVMYEVDTRLRPHGNSGVLITSAESFARHHASDVREVWERQMMTRCRPVYDDADIAKETYVRTRSSIYREYDLVHLRTDITAMRNRVESELGSPREKYDIKRGHGGIMDIDFITHYFQLAHGIETDTLQVSSTRKALKAIRSANLLDAASVDELLNAYNFLKRVETCRRVYDMKSIDTISRQPEANQVIARAMGYFDPHGEADAGRFMENFQSCTQGVRKIFTDIFCTD